MLNSDILAPYVAGIVTTSRAILEGPVRFTPESGHSAARIATRYDAHLHQALIHQAIYVKFC